MSDYRLVSSELFTILYGIKSDVDCLPFGIDVPHPRATQKISTYAVNINYNHDYNFII